MAGRKKHSKIIKIKTFLTTIILLILLIAIAIPSAKKIKLSLFANEEIELIKNKLEKIEVENSELKKLITYFGTPEYAEEQARLNLNFRKADEQVAVIYGQDEDHAQEQNKDINIGESAREEGEKSNPKRWREYFFKNY
ncbi:MAG: septum formation initiator family protein [Patescibacteria group bacterium]|nr:septum formation initiator family protein [Patescibacteria group bacterium]